MSAPERIWASADPHDGWRWPRASKFPEQGPRENVEYVRADLIPATPLAAPLVVPEAEQRVARIAASLFPGGYDVNLARINAALRGLEAADFMFEIE